MRRPGDPLGQSLLPLRARTLEGRDMLPFRRGDVAVQIGQFGNGLTQQRATRITAAGMFDVDKRLVGGGQPAGNLTPDRRVRTIARRAGRTRPVSRPLFDDLSCTPATPVPQIASGRPDRRQDERADPTRLERIPRAGEMPPAVSPGPPLPDARWDSYPILTPNILERLCLSKTFTSRLRT